MYDSILFRHTKPATHLKMTLFNERTFRRGRSSRGLSTLAFRPTWILLSPALPAVHLRPLPSHRRSRCRSRASVNASVRHTTSRSTSDTCGIDPRRMALKLRSFHNPTRKRVDVNIDISSLTHRVMKRTRLQSAQACLKREMDSAS